MYPEWFDSCCAICSPLMQRSTWSLYSSHLRLYPWEMARWASYGWHITSFPERDTPVIQRGVLPIPAMHYIYVYIYKGCFHFFFSWTFFGPTPRWTGECFDREKPVGVAAKKHLYNSEISYEKMFNISHTTVESWTIFEQMKKYWIYDYWT